MPLVRVSDGCYQALDRMRKEIVATKRAKGRPSKTTFGEVVCSLIRKRRG
jgi:hypothetical protein